MKVDLNIQADLDLTLPPMPVKMFTGSALPLEISGVPNEWSGGTVTGMSVTVTNANGVTVVGQCVRTGCGWSVLFAPSSFQNYGYVAKGVRFDATVKRADGTTAAVTLAVADLEIIQATASAQPGTPSAWYVVKGDRCFVRSRVVEGVQHFVEQTMEYDAQIGWGANWTGDYILNANGEFVEYTED